MNCSPDTSFYSGLGCPRDSYKKVIQTTTKSTYLGDDSVPGPGRYEKCDWDQHRKSAPAFSMRPQTSKGLFSINTTAPGPGAYDVNGRKSSGEYVSAKYKSRAGPSFHARVGPNSAQHSPGPGHYMTSKGFNSNDS